MSSGTRVEDLEREFEEAATSYSETRVNELERRVEELEGTPSEELHSTQFALAKLLLFSNEQNNIQRGIVLLKSALEESIGEIGIILVILSHLQTFGYRGQEALFYEIVGYINSGEYGLAREGLRRLTDTNPMWDRAVALRELYRRKIESDGPWGLALAGGAFVLGAVLMWWLTKDRSAVAAQTPSAGRPARPRRPVTHLPPRGGSSTESRFGNWLRGGALS